MTSSNNDHFRRLQRLAQLGVTATPNREFDNIAASIAKRMGTPWAMVNFPSHDLQFFSGLYQPQEQSAAFTNLPELGRTMPLDWGGCPKVLERKMALPLEHVLDDPSFMGNGAFNMIGATSYLGTAIIDPLTGLALGTVCAVDTRMHTWTMDDVQDMNHYARGIAKPWEDSFTHQPPL